MKKLSREEIKNFRKLGTKEGNYFFKCAKGDKICGKFFINKMFFGGKYITTSKIESRISKYERN